jgi:hypothetical protein
MEQRKATDAKNKKNPVRDEIEKVVGKIINLEITIEEDLNTLSQFKHIPGLIAFVSTIRKDSKIIGIGRGVSILNRINKFPDRTVSYALNQSILDRIVRSIRTLDSLSVKTSEQKDNNTENNATYCNEINESSELATDKQKKLLISLYYQNIQNEDVIEKRISILDELTKIDANTEIQSFLEPAS